MVEVSNNAPQCPLSDQEMKLWLSMPIDAITGQPMINNIYYCSESDYGMVFPRPSINAIADFYNLNNYYTQGESHFQEKSNNSFLDKLRVHIAWRFDKGVHLTAQLIDQLVNHKSSKICDIGCGSGQLLKELKMMGHDVMGVEPNERSTVYSQDLDVYIGTAENIPKQIAENRFDVIIMTHVLEHCLAPKVALSNIYELLRPGGYLICEVPNNACLGFKYSGVTWTMLDLPRHLNFFTSSNLQEICQQANFEIQAINYSGYCRQFSNSWIDYEREIYNKIIAAQVNPMPFPVKNSKFRAWQLLFLTLFATPDKKYDSISVIATKPQN
ncbi:hypothetical protein C7H19_01625 [Aphanothece hegewaldii CCALA 016]|uniref:Class I SAM-dependent methyltransferase n=2 Tax=Aphanothece TaxID=1121 RepID=A0A2T1M3V8_9CHRO|nr:hypothetical protein C7H19_01625 [Aphanothece hegewaldii CCALA 016]